MAMRGGRLWWFRNNQKVSEIGPKIGALKGVEDCIVKIVKASTHRAKHSEENSTFSSWRTCYSLKIEDTQEITDMQITRKS